MISRVLFFFVLNYFKDFLSFTQVLYVTASWLRFNFMDWLLWGFKVIVSFHFSFFLSLCWVSSSCTSLNGLEYFSISYLFFLFLDFKHICIYFLILSPFSLITFASFLVLFLLGCLYVLFYRAMLLVGCRIKGGGVVVLGTGSCHLHDRCAAQLFLLFLALLLLLLHRVKTSPRELEYWSFEF